MLRSGKSQYNLIYSFIHKSQLWVKKGSPKNINIVNFELGSENSPHLQKLIYGNPASNLFDGIHLHGEGASRHLTYRAVQAIKPVLKTNVQPMLQPDRFSPFSSHRSCPQAIFHQQQRSKQAQMYRNKKDSYMSYNIPTQNSFEVLGNY